MGCVSTADVGRTAQAQTHNRTTIAFAREEVLVLAREGVLLSAQFGARPHVLVSVGVPKTVLLQRQVNHGHGRVSWGS